MAISENSCLFVDKKREKGLTPLPGWFIFRPPDDLVFGINSLSIDTFAGLVYV